MRSRAASRASVERGCPTFRLASSLSQRSLNGRSSAQKVAVPLAQAGLAAEALVPLEGEIVERGLRAGMDRDAERHLGGALDVPARGRGGR